MDRVQEVRKLYGRLKALYRNIPTPAAPEIIGTDYARIVNALSHLIEDDLSQFDSRELGIWDSSSIGQRYYSADLQSRIAQLIGILEYGYNIAESVIEIGSLYNAIKDPELRERCGDLLTAPGKFDRVINQATLVLEDRIRRRTASEKHVVGVDLVNSNIKSDPANSTIVFSDVKSEQEGYANIVRGLMQALRNETHHHIVDAFSREDALSICGFIDRILRLIDKATIKS